jgi:endonuclease/exonuclease/phosphatase family metal-dependent hydrolase
MARSEQQPASRPEFILAVVLTTILGMQFLRGLLPYPQSLLIERLHWGTINAGLFALVIFLCSFLAGPLNRFFGSGLIILVTGFSIGLSRLGAQLWAGDPIGKMIFTATGVIAFIIFMPTAVGVAVGTSRRAGTYLAYGILAGLALDLALNGAFYSYDLIWQRTMLALAIVVFLVLLQWWSLFRLLRLDSQAGSADTRFGRALSWAIIGPFLFLQLLIFSNIAWAATSTGWSLPAVFFWLMLAYFLGVAIWLLPDNLCRIIIVLAWLVALVCLGLLYSGEAVAWLTAVYLLSGQIALTGTLVSVLSYLGGAGVKDGLRNISIANGLSMVILVVLLFAYYAVYNLSLPFSNQMLPLLALLWVAVFGFMAVLDYWRRGAPVEQSGVRILAGFVFVTLLIPLVMLLRNSVPAEPLAENEPLRVMTYNIHFGTDVKGELNLETLAALIEEEHPDVVSLQEVSRGWIINGSVDMAEWLAQRLDMNLVFGPASDGQWGNAVLTTLPVVEASVHPLPTEDLLLRRSFEHVVLSGGEGQDVNLINTHYHHLEDGGAVRVLQSEAILDYAAGLPNTIVTGDLNAEHGMAEIDMLVGGGFSDALHLAGVEPGYTNPVPDPWRRIDYVFVSPDWQVETAVVPYSEASDHLPIVVTLDRP